MKKDNETPPLGVAVAERQSLAVEPRAPGSQVTVPDMLQAVISKGVTAENVSAVTELVKLWKQTQEWDAEKDFNRAFVALQADVSGIKAERPVPNNDGSIRYMFAPFEDIMKAIRPSLERHGFTLSFSTDFAEGRMIKVCRLAHNGGHHVDTKFAVRVGQGPPKASECQADGAASTYAKRFALCDALNIVIEHDTDADPRAEGTAISADEAKALREDSASVGLPPDKFLKFAGAKSFEEISSGRVQELAEYILKEGQTKLWTLLRGIRTEADKTAQGRQVREWLDKNNIVRGKDWMKLSAPELVDAIRKVEIVMTEQKETK